MYFLIDKSRKIIFGWSAKCGCSHIKKIYWYLQNDKEDNKIHTKLDYNQKLPSAIKNYIIIIIIRNPYERLISGFLNKYKKDGEFRKHWKSNTLKFVDFVNEILINNWKQIDKHHFTPQTTELFDKNKLVKSKKLILYDIKNIDYKFIEDLYNKKIPDTLINFRGGHENKSTIVLEKNVFDLDILEYCDYRVPTNYFYNENLKKQVDTIYKNDFLFFKEYGFDYII